MNRATDICTCGKDRADHGNATGHEFMPHPQPLRPAIPVGKKVQDFVESLGEARVTGSGWVVKTASGELWEIQAFRRDGGEDQARSQEGV